MKNRDFSLLDIIPPPFLTEGKTSDIFQTYPVYQQMYYYQ